MSNQINDGGPAFPAQDWQAKGNHHPGMTLRDYFAAAALPVAWNAFDSGYFVNTGHESANHAVANAAYQIADAMIQAREVKP